MDTHILKNGYLEISPPLLASDNTMYGTGQLPKFENDQFEVKLEKGSDRKFLIPTAEVILTNIVKDKIVENRSFYDSLLQRLASGKKQVVMAKIQRE